MVEDISSNKNSRILVLCKRRPQNKDLLNRPYGRFFYLPYFLMQQGYKITLLLLDYEKGNTVCFNAHGMEWISVSLTKHPLVYLRLAEEYIKTYKPDWILGFSDTWYGILSVYLGKRYNVKTLIDAYDNYESYIPWLKPLHWLWRYSLRQATALSAAGPQLAELMSRGRNESLAAVIPMAADPIFKPINDIGLRKQFNLPEQAPLIGYCGSLYSSRGVSVLFESLELLLIEVPDVKLVISGRREKGLKIPETIINSVIHLGYLSDEKIPLLINAMDMLLVVSQDSAFGRFSYPVKLYEAMRCCRPVVASGTPSMEWILHDHPECLAEIGNPEDLARKLYESLFLKKKDYSANLDWVYSASILLDELEAHH